MQLADLFKKENMIKIAAILLIFVFLLSDFAIGILTGRAGNNPTNETSNEWAGEVIANATISSYRPYLITESNITMELLNQKLVGIEEIIPTSQGYVISLNNSKNITGIWSYLKSNGINCTAKAFLTLPFGVEIPTKNGTERISGTTLMANLEPIFEEGENVTIRLFIQTEAGKIKLYGQPTLLSSQKEFEKNATIVALVETKTIIRIPWEKRYDKEVSEFVANLTALHGQSSTIYSKKDFVIANLSGTKPQYVSFIRGDTVFVNNFTDKEQVKKDMNNVSFPDSYITTNASVNETTISVLNFTLEYTYTYNAKIDENEVFFALQSKTQYKQNDSVQVLISAYAIKNKITSIISAKEI